MFEYICDRLIPGCKFKSEVMVEEQAHEVAKDHLHEHHQVEYVDDEVWETIAKAVMPIPH